jgi:hypothetical protein
MVSTTNIIIQIKKFTTKQNFFTFFIKYLKKNLYFISHRSPFTIIQTNILQLYPSAKQATWSFFLSVNK